MTYTTFDTLFERFRYPAGESHLRRRAVSATNETVIEACTRNFDDLCQVVTADRLLRRNGVTANWFTPYFPFARHDRRNDRNDGFEIELAMELVKPVQLTIADPHSDVTGQLRHITQTSVVEEFRAAGAFDNNPIVIIPDAGATKKTYSWLQTETHVQALKTRDPTTGNLSGFQLLTDNLDGRPAVIVDDICDGGGTFLGLAAKLKEHNAGPLALAVTHGLFTKGAAVVSDVFDAVYTFSYQDKTQPNVDITYIPFSNLYQKGTHQ